MCRKLVIFIRVILILFTLSVSYATFVGDREAEIEGWNSARRRHSRVQRSDSGSLERPAAARGVHRDAYLASRQAPACPPNAIFVSPCLKTRRWEPVPSRGFAGGG